MEATFRRGVMKQVISMSRVMEQGAPWERDDSSLPEADIVARVEAFMALEV